MQKKPLNVLVINQASYVKGKNVHFGVVYVKMAIQKTRNEEIESTTGKTR